MAGSDSQKWSVNVPFAPRWAGEAVLLLRSFPVQFVGRMIAVLPTIAWILICGTIPLGLAAVCGLRLPTEESTLIWLFMVFPCVLYAAAVAIRVDRRLRRCSHQDERVSLVILDEVTFLGWGVPVAVTQLFRPFNQAFMLPARIVLSSPRAIKWSIFGLILFGALAVAWMLLPIRFTPWANQFGRGVVASASVTGFFVMAGIALLGVLLLLVVFCGFWAEMLVIGGGTALGAVMLKSLNPEVFSFVSDPLTAWAKWKPTVVAGLFDESNDLHAYLTGPGGVTPFGLVSMAVILHGVPLAVKKMNVAMFAADDLPTAESREERDNLVGWWLRVTAAVTLLVLPLFLCILNRSASLRDPRYPEVETGPFVAVCVLAAVGCLILLRLFRTKRRCVDRPNELVLSTIFYTRRCIGE